MGTPPSPPSTLGVSLTLPHTPPHIHIHTRSQEPCRYQGPRWVSVPVGCLQPACLLSAGPGCQALWVEWGPPSVTVSVGEEVRLQCLHNGSNTNVTWWRVPQVNSSWPPVMHRGSLGAGGELIFKQVNKSHRGMYRCEVSDGKKIQRSCGTYLRVRGECPSRPSVGKAGWSPCRHRLHLGHPGSPALTQRPVFSPAKRERLPGSWASLEGAWPGGVASGKVGL